MELISARKNYILVSDVTHDDAKILEWCGLKRQKIDPVYDEEWDEEPIELYEIWTKEG